VARTNFPIFPPYFPLSKKNSRKNLSEKSRNTCAKFHQNRLKTVTSRPELTSRHPTKEKIPYLVESETSLASLAQSTTVFWLSGQSERSLRFDDREFILSSDVCLNVCQFRSRSHNFQVILMKLGTRIP